jgi:hypothetical protein
LFRRLVVSGSPTENQHGVQCSLEVKQVNFIIDRRALLEIVRLTNEEDEIEGPMINYEIDLFDFERALDTMLIFSWRTGDYESSKQTYFQDDLGFRCAYWTE